MEILWQNIVFHYNGSMFSNYEEKDSENTISLQYFLSTWKLNLVIFYSLINNQLNVILVNDQKFAFFVKVVEKRRDFKLKSFCE